MKFTAEQILKAFESKRFALDDREGALNLFGVRSKSRQGGTFDDLIGALVVEDGMWTLRTWEATTDAGTRYLQRPINRSGTAGLVPGQYLDVWKIDMHNGWCRTLCQRLGSVAVYRDNDRDNELDYHPSRIQRGKFGINFHPDRLEPSGRSGKNVRASAGCQVFRYANDHREFMELVDAHADYYGDRFDYTLFDEEEIPRVIVPESEPAPLENISRRIEVFSHIEEVNENGTTDEMGRTVNAESPFSIDYENEPDTTGHHLIALSQEYRIKQLQRFLGVGDDGKIGPATLAAIENKLDLLSGVRVGKKALDLIIQFETGGQQYYNQKLIRPTWPGYSSGVTIGFGYDLGYNSVDQIRKDWRGLIPDADLNALVSVHGITGPGAKPVAESLRHIKISWDTAERVFLNSTLPRFVETTIRTFPGSEKLQPEAFGALVSLVFNRGGSLKNTDKRLEMRQIAEAIAKGTDRPEIYGEIAASIRKMKRHWERVNGTTDLHGRRDAEAALVLAT